MDGEVWFKENLGKYIRQKRNNLNLTLNGLACRTGVTSKHLGRLEHGEKLANSFTLAKIAVALETDLSEFLNQFEEEYFLEGNVYKYSK